MSAVEQGGRPQSVKEIAAEAQDFKFSSAVPLKQWLRTAKTLNAEAGIYLREGNFPKAYLLYMRQSHLILDYLSKHPDAKTKEGKAALTSVLKALPDVVVNLEQLKPIIDNEYNEWRAQEAERKEKRASRAATARKRTTYEQRASRDPALSSKAKVLDAGENLDLAVDLAKNEFKRRDANRKVSRMPGVSAEEEQSRRTAGFWNNWTDELARRQAEDEELFRRQMESTRKNLDGAGDSHIHEFVQRMSHADRQADREGPYANNVAAANYHYPSISKSTPVDYDRSLPKPRPGPTPQPPRPPKDLIRRPASEAQPPVPELPSKELLYSFPPQEPSREPPALPPKDMDSPPEPLATASSREHLTFKPAAYLENGDPIRCVVFPSKMRLDFLHIAADNTRRGIEMCGILCGTAVNNALFVRCLVIPEQKCTPDTCETENEGALFDFCEKEDLLQLGWIHTHPTQSCFMSSRDLHTQSGYQIMLPESIAIVCAPKFEPSYGIFRLTNPPGLPHILQCRETNTFHPHDVDNLYTGAEKPSGGHVYETDNLNYDIHDLRPGAQNVKRY